MAKYYQEINRWHTIYINGIYAYHIPYNLPIIPCDLPTIPESSVGNLEMSFNKTSPIRVILT